ncbi:MAG: 4-hydroxy-tetrahydrodipicolinate reductase, partial [Clostridia bacterium]|nr:4-hydroxy-tetrahydrodipicolinate reductase [Clostridia bacterium]
MEKTRIIICGACGKMGGNVLDLLKEDSEAVAVAGVDLYPREIGIPVYTEFSAVKEQADVIIDFSSGDKLKERLDYAKENGLGIVLASTGFTQDDLKTIDE